MFQPEFDLSGLFEFQSNLFLRMSHAGQGWLFSQIKLETSVKMEFK